VVQYHTRSRRVHRRGSGGGATLGAALLEPPNLVEDDPAVNRQRIDPHVPPVTSPGVTTLLDEYIGRSRVAFLNGRGTLKTRTTTEEGVSAILLQAKSRHEDPRTLAKYAKPNIEAVAALTAEFDRGRRHRQ